MVHAALRASQSFNDAIAEQLLDELHAGWSDGVRLLQAQLPIFGEASAGGHGSILNPQPSAHSA